MIKHVLNLHKINEKFMHILEIREPGGTFIRELFRHDFGDETNSGIKVICMDG